MQNKTQKVQSKSQNFLDKIVANKKLDLVQETQITSLSDPQIIKKSVFRELFQTRDKKIRLIAEIKFASPTNPTIGSQEDLLERANAYEKAGADAISIITEKHFFKGDVAFVPQIKNHVLLQVLQKDFVIDPQQIYQAREVRSDALLLIARLVDKEKLKEFVNLCFALKIEPVVEINNEEDLEKAIATDTKIIAVNARDLETFEIDVSKACRLIKKIPDHFITLGFSGIISSKEVLLYKQSGAVGVLVGTSLMKTKNIYNFIKDLQL
jgi:indole-3-glycerol phosphate synthase